MASHWWPYQASTQPTYEPDMQRSEIAIEDEVAGLQALKIISQSSLETQSTAELNTGAGRDISATLESALSLSRDPATIRHLANPDIISDCIKLMVTIRNRRTGAVSPFSNQLGWLCLRLLVITLNLCLLERCTKLDETLALSNQRPDIRAAPHILASTHIGCGITAQFNMIDAGGDPDWVFGWSTSPRFPRQALLLPASEALALMNLFWNDRKLFFSSLISCPLHSRPGLSGLFYMFSRSLAHVRPQPNLDIATLESRVYELGIWYLLVAEKYQLSPVLRICEASTRLCSAILSRDPKYVDADDSQAIITAFVRQCAVDDEEMFRGKVPLMMLQLVPFAIDTEAQNLIPDVMRCAIAYAWSVLLELERRSNRVGGLVENIFSALRMIIYPAHNRPYRLKPPIQKQIIEVLHEQDLPDLTARIIIRLDPQNAEMAENTLATIFEFYEELFNAIDTKSDLELRFRHYVPEWWRVHRYMLFTGYATSASPPADYHEHYTKRLKAWGLVDERLGIDAQVSKYQGVACFNDRCSLAYTCTCAGARFACAGCDRAFYCDDRCESMDWEFGGLDSHRATCNPGI